MCHINIGQDHRHMMIAYFLITFHLTYFVLLVKIRSKTFNLESFTFY